MPIYISHPEQPNLHTTICNAQHRLFASFGKSFRSGRGRSIPPREEDAGEGVRVAHVGGGRPRPRLPLREGRRVPAHPRRLLPRPQAPPAVPQTPAARRGAHLRGRQRHPRRVEEDPAPHRGEVQEPGVQGAVRPGRAGAGVHRAVAADGGAELRHPQRRHGLQPRLPAARHAARRRQGRPPGGGRARRRRDEPDAPAEDGGDAAAVRQEPQGAEQAAGHLRAAPGRGGLPGRHQVHARRPVPPAQRRPPRRGPAVGAPHQVAQERQQVVGHHLPPRFLGQGQGAAAPAVRGGALLISIANYSGGHCQAQAYLRAADAVADFCIFPLF